MKFFLSKIQRHLLWWIGSVLLVVPALFHAYWLMPFPGSQDAEKIEICYYLEKIIPFLRIAGVLFLAGPVLHSFFYGTFKNGIGNVLWCSLIAVFFLRIVFTARTKCLRNLW